MRALPPWLQHRHRREVIILVAIIILATALRFYKLGAWSFWIDEIFTLNRAARHVNLPTILAEWWRPPVSLIMIAGALDIFGVSEWSARLVPVLIAIVTIPILYLPVKRLFGAPVALIMALLLAVSPWHLEWSQNARFYTSLLLFYFLSAYTFYLAIEKDRPLYLLATGVLFLIAIGERFMAAFLLPSLIVYLLTLAIAPLQKPAGFNWRNLALILLPGIVLMIVEAVRYLTTGSSYLLDSVDLIYTAPISDPFRLATFIAFDIGIPVLCLAFFAGAHLIGQRNRGGIFVIINALVPVVILLAINPFYFTQDRYVFMVLPFWLILASIAVNAIFQQTKRSGSFFAVAVLALLVAHAAGDNLLYYHVNNGNRHDWKGAFALVQEQRMAGDQVVSWWTQFGPYYLDQEIISWETIDPEAVTAAGTRFWFVLDEDTVWGNRRMKPWMERNAELVNILFLRRQREQFLYIYLYEPES